MTAQDTAGLKVADLSTEHAAAFLAVCAEYFERRPTDGEDAAHWANVSNGAMCRKIAAMFAERGRALEAMGRELAERNDEIVGERWHADEAARQRDVWKERATTAERLLSESQAEGRRKDELIRWAYDTLMEINVSNYDHDDVCRLNEASVEVILGLAKEAVPSLSGRTVLAARDEGSPSQNIRPNVSGDGQHLTPLDERKPNGGATHDV